LIFSLNYTEADFAAVAEAFLTAAARMEQDGWWWRGSGLTNKAIRRQITREMLARSLPWRAAGRVAGPAGWPAPQGKPQATQ
jgi:glutamate-1-semialdehyde 2,1-aminomutase